MFIQFATRSRFKKNIQYKASWCKILLGLIMIIQVKICQKQPKRKYKKIVRCYKLDVRSWLEIYYILAMQCFFLMSILSLFVLFSIAHNFYLQSWQASRRAESDKAAVAVLLDSISSDKAALIPIQLYFVSSDGEQTVFSKA